LNLLKGYAVQWKKLSQWAMRGGAWVVGKAMVQGKPIYCLTLDGDNRRLFFPTFDEAKQYAEKNNHVVNSNQLTRG
jgi:hypothetical protein